MTMLFYAVPNETFPGSFPTVDSCLEGYNQRELMSSADDKNQMVDYMLNKPSPPLSSNFCCSHLCNELSITDLMKTAVVGAKIALNEAKIYEEETGIDPVHFLKLPISIDNYLQDGHIVLDHLLGGDEDGCKGFNEERKDKGVGERDHETQMEDNTSMQPSFHGENLEKTPIPEARGKRKRPRTVKTKEEVEIQRMIHISVERNRRKQMNEHLRVLKSLMPDSFVQRGDQASIIGAAIEFIRELEQLLQCLELQKKRGIYGYDQMPIEGPSVTVQQAQAPLIFTKTHIPNGQLKMAEYDSGLQKETADSKSSLADVEVKLLGFDGLIKILSTRRPGQLIKTIASLEDLQLNILHTNITTFEQNVLYSFNVKISGEARFTAEDIANSIQKVFSSMPCSSMS